ncbi:unnamed protein product, partial [Mesorhabditis spiculigera]
MDSVQTPQGSVAISGSSARRGPNNTLRLKKAPNPKKEQQVFKEEGGCGPYVQRKFVEHFIQQASFYAFVKPENAERRRSPAVLLLDATRVVLRDWPHDFVHASWVCGLDDGRYEDQTEWKAKQKKYIAAQAPHTPAVAADFWHMCAQEGVEGVVLLGEEDAKAVMTAPKCGDYNVKVEQKSEQRGFTVHSVQLAGKIKHSLTLFCLAAWSVDEKPPVETFAKFRQAIWAGVSGKKPIVVTCKFGTYRTGLFLIYDIETERIEKQKKLDLDGTVKDLRMQRHHVFDEYSAYEVAIDMFLDVCKGQSK